MDALTLNRVYQGTMPTPLTVSLAITHLVMISLLLSFVGWQLLRPEGPSLFFLVIQTLPLLILIPGMMLNRPRTYIWLCFIMLVYFVKGVDGMVSPARVWIDYVVLLCSVILFVSGMMSSRWLQNHLRSL